MDEPNAVWTVDFKGQFKMLNGATAIPLPSGRFQPIPARVQRAVLHVDRARQATVFIKVFREFGVPAVIRSDNGTPFASIGLARLTRLSARWIRLGIRPYHRAW